MAYIVQADLSEVLSEKDLTMLTDDDRAGVPDVDRVTRAITSAEGIVNGYLNVRYIVPITGVIPDIIQKWSVDIAKYFLYQRRRVPEDVRLAYQDAIAGLRDVAAGKMTLGIDPVPPVSPQLSGIGAVYGPARIFTRDTLGSY